VWGKREKEKENTRVGAILWAMEMMMTWLLKTLYQKQGNHLMKTKGFIFGGHNSYRLQV
jgi:hypothetical protein